MEKEVKIQVPKGYVIDEENSTFECIRFKKKDITLETIFELYEDINQYDMTLSSTSGIHMLKIGAINRLLYVAKYLNNGWVPNFKYGNEKYYLSITDEGTLQISTAYHINVSFVYFKSEELAQQAIDILGEDNIKKALNVYY